MDLRGKVSLVTGGTSGIGAATAIALAQKGALVATASRNGAAGPHAAGLRTALQEQGASVLFLEADVADPTACSDCVKQAVEAFGRLDVLIHSAGGAFPGSLHTVSDETWMAAFATHVHSVFHLTRAAAPHLSQHGNGAIVLIGSAAGLRGCLGALVYGVVKGTLPQFARNLARELADQHVRVNCVSPGVIRTPFQDHLTAEQTAANILHRIPLHKEGTPEDVADIIVALVENDFITGENFVIDGGMTCALCDEDLVTREVMSFTV